MSVQEQIALLDARLDALSVARRLITSLGFEPTAVELAVFQPNIGYAAERPAIPFQFEVTPWKSDPNLPGATPSTVLRAHASITNFLNPMMPMPTTSFAFMVALPPSEAEAIYYRDPVADTQEAVTEAPPAWLALEPMGHSHPAVQNEITRAFGLPLGTLFPTRGGVTFTSRVMGHRLSRHANRYSEPGSGTWTLFRAIEPGDGWVGLDLVNGMGEFFAAGDAEGGVVFAQHIAKATA